MIAKVIVDVPARQTNRAFDYVIPPHLMIWIDIGSRVVVSFGPRLLQGFVMDIVSDTQQKEDKMKQIEDVLDVVPSLTKEMVSLAQWMSQYYICPMILTFQAMLPTALKSKYERTVQLGNTPIPSSHQHAELMYQITNMLQGKSKVFLQDLVQMFPAEVPVIKWMMEEGILTTEQTLRNVTSVKKIPMIEITNTELSLDEQINSLPRKADKQKEVLQFLYANRHPIAQSELCKKLEINLQTLKSLNQRGYIKINEREVYRDPYANRNFAISQSKKLTIHQQKAYDSIKNQLIQQKFHSFVLLGVTGSGKTEIYLQAIQSCLELGKKSIVLVPEISLTPQMVQRFKERFNEKVAVWHSRLSVGERYDEWRKMRNQQVDIVVGARSAIFAPFTNIGLIIIDEEHEASYKQEESPKYHARTIACKRAQFHQATVVLGSATPALETIYSTYEENNSKHSLGISQSLLTLDQRIENRPLPSVHLVDMREELKAGNRSMFSRELHLAISQRLEKKEQMILLLNRRGYATFVICRSCGYVCTCPHCEISMTYHQNNQTLRCHYCGYTEPMVSTCPSCQSTYIRQFGTGTQRIEDELTKLFPQIRIIRMDVDTTTEKGSHEKWLTQFERGEADVLLGTQMVAKGLDFKEVTLVGVLAADSGLNLPDFRAQERTFQLITQVAGRAGRHQKKGEVIVQTYSPEHPIIQAASKHDYASFAESELALRAKLQYPPYRELIAITFSHSQLPFLISQSHACTARLKECFFDLISKYDAQIEILGPVASPITKIKDRYRFQCVIKYAINETNQHQFIQVLASAIHEFENEQVKNKLLIQVDVDPQHMM